LNNNIKTAVRYHQAGQFQQAESLYNQILQEDPGHADALHLLGVIARQRGEYDLAVELITKAIAKNSSVFIYHNNLGNAFKDLGRLDDAVECYEKALRLRPNFPEAYNNLGNAFKDLGELDSAVECYEEALHLKPDYAAAHLNLGFVLRTCGKLDAAIDRYSKALRLKPDFAEAFNNLGNALKDQGRLVEARECFKKALQLKPEFAHVHSNLLLSLNYSHTIDPGQLFSHHKQWHAQHAAPLATTILPHLNSRLQDRRLKIGYVSPDFRMHSVAYFIESVLTLHARTAFEIFCYSDLVRSDSATHRLKNLEAHWRDIFGMSDEQAATLIRDDQIDILMDLAGHTSGNRMLLFARKPAPIQITYIGYPSSTGLSTIDYRITDSWADPPGQTEQFYTEELVRLPQSFLCYKPPEYASEIRKQSVLEADDITFGSFNHRAKITPIVVKLWSEILTSLPNTKLVLKYRSLSDNGTQNLLLEMFLKNGVFPERIKFVGHIPSPIGHLELYNSIDIGLDTFPYNGTTTTCEAMWMGTPVIVLSGQNHISRVGVSLLSNIGLTELIAESTEDYLEKAIKLAGDLKRLHKLQAGLRDMMSRSSLTDDHQFIHVLEDVYRKMWLSWLSEDKKE